MTADVIARFAGARVLCVGDLMLDRYTYGSVDRVSPEAPVPVLRLTREVAMLGGAGNVARNLAALGAEVDLVAVAGDDSAGREIDESLRRHTTIRCAIQIEPGRRTTVKTRFVAGGQQLLRADWEVLSAVGEACERGVEAAALAAIPECGAVALSDYGKGLLTPRLIARIIEAARQAGVPVVVDPKGRDYAIYRGATVITPNRRELAEATGRVFESEGDLVDAARELRGAIGADALLVTRSQDGMSLITQGDVLHVPTRAREVYDVSGAGDTVVATLAVALASGVSLEEGVPLANAAAGIVVGKVGTAVVSPAELRREAAEVEPDAAGILPEREMAADIVRRWRGTGLTVGFTNGCFDLLHPGHLALLRRARRECDRLVVGINSDASVSRLKGPERPVQALSDRATMLAALPEVDLVVAFEEDTPLELIRTLHPDVLVKGADYRPEDVVGASDVIGWGGRLVLADLLEGRSTSRLVARARSQ